MAGVALVPSFADVVVDTKIDVFHIVDETLGFEEDPRENLGVEHLLNGVDQHTLVFKSHKGCGFEFTAELFSKHSGNMFFVGSSPLVFASALLDSPTVDFLLSTQFLGLVALSLN